MTARKPPAPRRRPEVSIRVEELEAEILAFGLAAAAAATVGQHGPSVTAMTKQAAARRQLADIRGEIEAAAVRDPVRRLELLRSRASAAGSYVAAVNMGVQIKDLRDKLAAERKAREEEAGKDVTKLLAEMDRILSDLPDALRDQLLKKWIRR